MFYLAHFDENLEVVIACSPKDKGYQEFKKVDIVDRRTCFSHNTFNGLRFMEVGIGTNDKKTKQGRDTIVLL